jgi:uncharacterized phage protein (TIGR02220 family)
MKIVGASEDDLKLLIAKRFVLSFDSGVIVIKHWRMHNTLSKQRYHETQYLDEKAMLKIKNNGSYSLTDGKAVDDSHLVGMFERRTSGEQAENADLDLDLGLDKDLGIDKDLDTEEVMSSCDNATPDTEIIKRIIDYLNTRCGTNYHHSTKNTQKHIRARFADGFTEEDFYTVIDKKAMQWIGDKKMEQYLRPDTLFGTKFESYLNQVVATASVVNNKSYERADGSIDWSKV